MSDVNIVFGELPEEFDPEFENFWTRLQREFRLDEDDYLGHKRANQASIEEGFGPALDEMEKLHHLVMDATNWSSEVVNESLSEDLEDGHAAQLLQTLIGLGARALLAFDEIIWLLKGGYPNGALGRLRTLQEVHVVIAAITEYGDADGPHPDLLDRYLLHQEVFAPKTAELLRAVGGDGIQEILDDQVTTLLKRRKNELLKSYGREFGTQWGWASPLFKDGRASFMRLNDLILPSTSFLYGWSSHRLHASSEGLKEDALPQSENRIGYSGSATDQGLYIPAVYATTYLLAIASRIVPTKISKPEDSEPLETGRLFLGALHRTAETVRNLWAMADSHRKD